MNRPRALYVQISNRWQKVKSYVPQGMTKNILQAEITHAGVFYLVKAETDGSYEESNIFWGGFYFGNALYFPWKKMNIISR